MKKIFTPFVLFLVLAMALSACKLPARGTPPPLATTLSGGTTLPEASPTLGTGSEAEATDTGVLPTETSLPAVTATPVPVMADTLVPVEAATATLPPTAGQTATSVAPPPVGIFDPNTVYGEPDFEDPMTGGSISDWWDEHRQLPNTDYIRLTMDDARFYVTGKQPGFSTWYFTWRDLDDFFLEATMDSATCAGQDAYGLIIRGPEHQAGESYGYVVAFSCDGQYWVFRLDSADPFTTEDLVSWTPSQYINAGQNRLNTIGIEAVGDTLTIYANGYQITEVVDSTYDFGRFGVFVSPQWTTNYIYRVVNLSYWELGE
jgi:hypothetical protein